MSKLKMNKTAKYKKRQKKERANRKAKRQTIPITPVPAFTTEDISVEEKEVIDSLPVSPARRAFQDN